MRVHAIDCDLGQDCTCLLPLTPREKARNIALPFDREFLTVNQVLAQYHYLGPTDRGFTYRDSFGVCVFANPSSRRLPQGRWLELVRWCLYGEQKNSGSQQWRAIVAWLRATRPEVTTVVSYSDPSAGHTGALYRACNWLWAPTWLRLREPPSGNGNWGTGRQAPKDRWVFCLQRDPERAQLLSVQDASLMKRIPWAAFREKTGGDFKQWKRQVNEHS